MCPAYALAAHRRLAALNATALALGLTACRYGAETSGEGLMHWVSHLACPDRVVRFDC
jgi:hypothetical protein